MSVIEIGSIVEGKVIKIKPFGAIVALENNVQGLVHISQVSHSYVQNINDHLKVGDTVSVKVLSIDNETKKISLSIREATEKKTYKKPDYHRQSNENRSSGNDDAQSSFGHAKPQENGGTLEDKLKDWLKQSNERQAGLNKRNNRR